MLLFLCCVVLEMVMVVMMIDRDLSILLLVRVSVGVGTEILRNWLYLIENNDENLAEKGMVYKVLGMLEGKD